MRKKVRTTEVNKIVTAVLKKDDISYADEAYQWNYGQILRIQGGNLPKAVEVHFSLEETSGTSVTRIGTTTDGVMEAPIPDSLLENNNCSRDYTIYAYIYLEDGTAGRTEYEIAIPVKARTNRKSQEHRKNRNCSGRQLRQLMTQLIGRSRQSRTPRQVRQKLVSMLPVHRRVQLQQKRPRKMP